jgi:CDP-diacylglycerol--glycerol-3-phosphate 3-phosphatidyltransferase
LTSFHTYIAKVAAVSQGIFILVFFWYEPSHWLFLTTTILTSVDLIEETILIILIPVYRTDIKGWYWLNKENADRKNNPWVN